jgi:ligand-binding sensor domain-containing protein
MRRWAAALVFAAAIAGGWALYRAAQAERQASGDARRSGDLAFQFTPFASSPPPGWSAVASPADFRDAVVWRGNLYIAGANTLFRYTEDGRLDRSWRSGFELPAASMQCLAAAPDALWIGTQGEGALSFDGTSMRRLLPASNGARKVAALLPLATGALLLGTSDGVLRFDGSRLRVAHPALGSIAVTALGGSEEDLWTGTRDSGVIHLRAGHAERYGEAEGLPDKSVHALTASAERAWAGTSTGIAEFEGSRVTRVLAPGLLARSLFVDGDELLAGTLLDGWLRIPLADRTSRLSRQSGDGEGEVRKVFKVGTDFYILRPGSMQVVRSGKAANAVAEGAPMLTHGNISALSMDSAGRLWVGYFDRGLDLVDPNRERIAHVESDLVFCVNRITASEDGQRMAVATANGLVIFDAAGKQRQTLTRADGLIASHVTDVIARGDGWVAGTPAGITLLTGAPRSIYAFQGLVNNHVYALSGGNGDQVLAGTLGGVSVLKGDSIAASYTTANSGLKTNWITAFARAGKEWFAGTYGGGVQRFTESGGWQTFDSMPANVVVNPGAMAASERAVYAGTLEHGLLVWQPQAQTWRQIRAGLPSSNVTAILYHDNRLYLGTDNGLVTAPESALGF